MILITIHLIVLTLPHTCGPKLSPNNVWYFNFFEWEVEWIQTIYFDKLSLVPKA